MPGESPGRDWDALLRPPTVADAVRDAHTLKRARLIHRLWTGFVWIVIGLALLGWLSVWPWVLRAPAPWGWLLGLGWPVSLGVILFIVVVILRRLERLLPRAYQAWEP
jgi:hypothetical protein